MQRSAEQSAPVLTCERVFAGYGRELVLRDVSLDIPRKSLVLLMGPNGAGKTTLLKVFLGLVKPWKGRVSTPFLRTPPGYVPQQKILDPLYPVSLRQIVALGLYPELGPWRKPTGTYADRLDAALAWFNLLEHGSKRFSELSGGMRQKALIARAFVSGADVFILDEPTSELDERSECDVVDHLTRLVSDMGKVVLLVHHGLGRAARLADWVCMVNRGQATMLQADEHHSMESVADAARRGMCKGRAV